MADVAAISIVIPAMDELRRSDNLFFRRGRTGSHRDEMPSELHELFWSRPDNRAAMALAKFDGADAG